jgi:ketosteroid isomerase-like protein
MAHPNEELARKEMELLSRDDLDGILNLYAEDVVLHYPGRNPLSGDYHGKAQLLAFFERAAASLDGGISRELHDALGSDDHAVQLLSVRATRGERSHHWRAVAVMHVSDGRISEIWLHVDDQYALDDFLS